jgi:hypothetical protein
MGITIVHSEEPDDDLANLLATLKTGQPCPPTRDELDAGFAAAMAMGAAANTNSALAAKLDELVMPR